MNGRIVWLIALLALPPLVGAQHFFKEHAEGWFWYQEPLPVPVPEETVLEPGTSELAVETPPAPPAVATDPSDAAAASDVAPLSAPWFRQNLEHYRDAAIDHPTAENIKTYLYLQRVAMDKASRFADAVQLAAYQDPFLDEGVRRPLASFAAAQQSQQAGEARQAVTKSLAAMTGIWFFYRSDCPHCHLQATVLQTLERLYGFQVYPIALDGAPLPDHLYPHYTTDQGQARLLGVTTVPALFLARPPDDLLPIGYGALSLDQLLSRMLTVAAEAGWIDKTDFNRTRPVKLDWTLRTDGRQLTAAMLQNPAQLIQYLRAGGDNALPALGGR